VQTVARLFASGIAELGHAVRVVTKEPTEKPDDLPFEVVRRPSQVNLLQQFRWAELVVFHGVSVSLAWPILLIRKPAFAIHYMPDPAKAYRRRINDTVRGLINRCCRHLSVSAAFRPPIRQPYEPAVMPIDTGFFSRTPGAVRDKDLFFIGRLMDFKGVHDLLDAVLLLNARGHRYQLTMVGEGPEENNLARRVQSEALAGQVDICGPLDGPDLVAQMNRHKLIVVPSRYDEPFGLVALEGIACGCVAVGTAGGGLPLAIGPCGVTVPNGNAAALADAIERLLTMPSALNSYLEAAPAHVAAHTPRAAAEALWRQISP